MAPQASQYCRQALQRQINATSSGDSVWIPETLLAAAFERYCRISSKTCRRNASHIAGPLESRRRLGKRQIGDLHALAGASSPPAWAFQVPMDLSQWQWEPPWSASALEHNRIRRENQPPRDHTVASWLTTLPPWLAEWSPPQVADDPLPSSPFVADPTPPNVVTTEGSLSARIGLDALCLSIANASLDKLRSDTDTFCRKYQQFIFLGEIPPDQLLGLSAELWTALDSRFEDSPVGQGLYLALYSAITTGIATSRVLTPSLLDDLFWNTMLARISKLPVNDELCALFSKLMGIVPTSCFTEPHDGLLSILENFFCAWCLSPKSKTESKSTTAGASTLGGTSAETQLHHVRAISAAMEAINSQEHGQLLDAANQLVLERILVSAPGQCELRYNWLCVLAHMPQVNQDFLFAVFAGLSASPVEIRPLTDTELCSLAYSHWRSRSYLKFPKKVHRKYESLCSGQRGTAIAGLVMAIASKEPPYCHAGLYTSLWKFLATINRLDDMVASLKTISQSRRIPLFVLQGLADTCENHRVALSIHDLYRRQLQTSGGPDWDPAVFDKYADRIVLDPFLPPHTIWQALDIDMFGKGKGARTVANIKARHHGTFGARRAAIVRRVATLFSHAPHLRNRVALRHVSQCVRFLEVDKDGLSPAVVKALYHVVSRDLKEGQPGRTNRLRWFLSVVMRNLGSEVATGCEFALKRWRANLRRIWLSGGTQEKQ
ncbi:hypothetical protein B0T22DRAFT_369470 [Podospora appendiculata]|uniref:Uncharacterized protein n=1 Tax=Podospora appendiculata TaxID=314037 RepID=A0AAE1CHM1_9PEZI|nr:hypothetical protein B0T22DRAFT_369470 [Podospora appendiculata]